MQTRVLALNIVFLLFASYVAATPPITARDTGAESLFLTKNVAAQAVQRIVGGGVDLGSGMQSPPRATSAGHEIVWESYRDITAGPMRHVFYQQVLRVGDTTTQLLGGFLALHFRSGEGLTSLMGTQFVDARPTNARRLSALEATIKAREQLARRAGFQAEPPLAPFEALQRARAATFRLLSTGDGRSFRYAYTTTVADATGHPFEVDVDADTAAVIFMNPANPDACIHAAGTQVAATGTPFRPGLPQRSLQANSPSQEPGYPYEGIWHAPPAPNGWNYPDAIVLQDTTDQSYMCAPTSPTGHSYTVFPVLANGSAGLYADSGPFQGRMAVDALFFTHETFQALPTIEPYFPLPYFSNAPIQIQQTTATNNCFYNNSSSGGVEVPPKSVYCGPNTIFAFPLTSSMDVVAHEWGHGVIYTLAGWPYSGVGAQLHEGFADAVGHMIEKSRQPAGFGVEQSSDWHIAEDSLSGTYMRSGTTCDGDGGHVYAGVFVNNRWHRDDTTATNDAHDWGNMVSVAFRMVCDGGHNNVCDLHNFSGCSNTTTGIGLVRASRIFLQAIVFYGYPSEDWTNLADGMCVAARDDYCGYFEQDQIMRAFAAIGYPATYAPFGC